MYDRETINSFVDVIVETVQPDKVILFGSYAYGKPNEHSDIDLLVIKNAATEITLNEENEFEFLVYKKKREKGIKVRSDVFYRTQAQAEETARRGGSFIDALTKGVIVYECKYI